MTGTPRTTSRCASEASTSIRRPSLCARSFQWVPSISRLARPILARVYGILGGTFDPPHIGHLALAATALEQLDLDVVRFVPARDPWQKTEIGVTEAHHRLAMTRLAAAESAGFVVDTIEMDRAGPTYTVDTVEAIDDRCVLILGADAAIGMPSWHRYEDLAAMVDVAVVERPGYDMNEIDAVLASSVKVLHMPTIDLSGTEIRAHVAAGRSPRFLVPDAVVAYIVAAGLYADGSAP